MSTQFTYCPFFMWFKHTLFPMVYRAMEIHAVKIVVLGSKKSKEKKRIGFFKTGMFFSFLVWR